MIDLHTHILPGWDDGANGQAEAERMIEMARQDGISRVVLTPHVYRPAGRGSDSRTLKSRMRAFLKLCKAFEVDLYPGAEVYVHADMIQHIKDSRLTVNGSNYVFIEFPAGHLPAGVTNLIYRMMLSELIPIIGHPERNSVFAQAPETLYDLVRQGAIAQVTAQSLLGRFGKATRRAAEVFLRHGLVHLIASDAHDPEDRPPRLAEAVERAAKIVGMPTAEAMVTSVPEAILNNEQIPDLGEPAYPVKKSGLRALFR